MYEMPIVTDQTIMFAKSLKEKSFSTTTNPTCRGSFRSFLASASTTEGRCFFAKIQSYCGKTSEFQRQTLPGQSNNESVEEQESGTSRFDHITPNLQNNNTRSLHSWTGNSGSDTTGRVAVNAVQGNYLRIKVSNSNIVCNEKISNTPVVYSNNRIHHLA